MNSEWMKVMLEEISRKKTEADQARIDEQALIDARARIDEQALIDARARIDEQRRRDEPGPASRSCT